MRPLNAAIVAFGVALTVTVTAYLLDQDDDPRYAAEVAAMLALAVCAGLAGPPGQRPVRLPLVAFCLLLAAAALVELVGHMLPVPPLSPLDPNGCPTDTNVSYWRAQLRYGQVTEVLRFAALASATYAVVSSSRPPRKRSRPMRIATMLILAVLTLIGLLPLTQVADQPGLPIAAVPGVLTLFSAVTLTVTTLSRVCGRRDQVGVLLAVSAVTMLLPAVIAVEALADIERQTTIPDNSSGETLRICSFAIEVPPAPSTGSAVFWAGGAVLLFAAPALFVWSVLNLGASAPPTSENETDDHA